MEHSELTSLLFPHIIKRLDELKEGMRLVHYTSAENAYKIISGKQIWLRNSQMMNDYSEVEHGLTCLYAAWRSPAGEALQEMLERIKNGLRDRVAELFDGHSDGLRQNTFIFSVSEHGDLEDQLGRLSMWRAYGGANGVALVLNNTGFISETDTMHVFSSPVFYQDIETFVDWFQGWADDLVAAEPKLDQLGPEIVRDCLFLSFRSFALCTKHPAFEEEREWRIFHSPTLEGESDWIEPSTEVIDGVPQRIMKLLLKDDPAQRVRGVAPPTLIDSVIIGPCEHPVHIRDSIKEALEQAGVEVTQENLRTSHIPLRSQ